MNKLLTTLSILLITTVSYAQTYTVERVIDAATLELSNGEVVRLIGIDIYTDRVADMATSFVMNLVERGREVYIEFDVNKKDKDQRLLAYVFRKRARTKFLSDQHTNCDERCFVKSDVEGDEWLWYFLNAEIINMGYAATLMAPPNIKYAGFFERLSKEAKQKKRGIWNVKQVGDSCQRDYDCIGLDCKGVGADQWYCDYDGFSACVEKRCTCLLGCI